jgi:hypothetical protein
MLLDYNAIARASMAFGGGDGQQQAKSNFKTYNEPTS